MRPRCGSRFILWHLRQNSIDSQWMVENDRRNDGRKIWRSLAGKPSGSNLEAHHASRCADIRRVIAANCRGRFRVQVARAQGRERERDRANERFWTHPEEEERSRTARSRDRAEGNLVESGRVHPAIESSQSRSQIRLPIPRRVSRISRVHFRET